ncbi:MAG: hypothetical protein O3C34_07870 [Proteobacteria bacterium]|nr:hypothetical protein [Pseudomonadota bacterium]
MIETKCRDIGRLYEALKVLEATLAGTVDRDELAQEILDFLAMAAGLKPVFVLGRGLDSQRWVDGAAGLAEEFGFYVVRGILWDATPFDKFPRWYRDYTVERFAALRAVYVCSSAETAEEIESINEAGGRLSMSAEARLLGYPECCVAAHHVSAGRYHQAILSIVKRLAGGDRARMQALLRSDVPLFPKTARESANMEDMFLLDPAPFGSWNQCRSCAEDDHSPSAKLSEKYRALAETTDLELSRTLSTETG